MKHHYAILSSIATQCNTANPVFLKFLSDKVQGMPSIHKFVVLLDCIVDLSRRDFHEF